MVCAIHWTHGRLLPAPLSAASSAAAPPASAVAVLGHAQTLWPVRRWPTCSIILRRLPIGPLPLTTAGRHEERAGR